MDEAIVQLEADVFSCTTALGVLTERGEMVQRGLVLEGAVGPHGGMLPRVHEVMKDRWSR